MTSLSNEDESWRVLLVAGLDLGKANSIRSFTLPEPSTGRPQGFLLVNGHLLEVNRFKQAYSAWLSDDRLLADGGMFMGTPYDPLFVLLPILERGRDQDEASPAGKFKELDELLYDSATPGLSELLLHTRAAAAEASAAAKAEAVARPVGQPGAATPEAATTAASTQALKAEADAAAASAASAGVRRGGEGLPATADEDATAPGGQKEAQPGRAAAAQQPLPSTPPTLEQQLACICDVRRVDEQCFYRLNDQRALAWLVCKFRQMQAALAAQVAGMEAPYASSYVLSYLADYVSDPWVTRVAKHLGISEKPPGTSTTLQPTDGNAQHAPPLSRPPPTSLAGPPEKRQKVDPKAASKQAAMAKQAAGTKKLTSFFTKK